MVEDAKVAREFRSEGIPPYKAGKEDRRLWNAGMRGLHDVEIQAWQCQRMERIMPRWYHDPRLADLRCHHRYLEFQLRDFNGGIVTICFKVGYLSSNLDFLLAVVIVPTLFQRKKVQPSNKRSRRNHHRGIATM